jgi:hypothetical protein
MKVRIKAGEQQVESQVLGPAAAGGLHHIQLVITWDGNRPATLVEVRDNSKRLPIVPTVGKGRLEISYDTQVSGSHYIECKLEFPGRTLKDLKATGSIDNGPSMTVDEEAERADMWRAEGSL